MKTITGYEEEIANDIAVASQKPYMEEDDIKKMVLDILKSYRWHVIERVRNIAGEAMQTANIENKL